MAGRDDHPAGSRRPPGHLEIWRSSGRTVVELSGERTSLGKEESNDVAVPEDAAVSRLHAVIERYPSGWCIRDVGSRNGTFVNGGRVWGEHRLRPGDEIRIGATRIVYWGSEPPGQQTAADLHDQPPDLTKREREVLLALCRPVLLGQTFTKPASIRAMAEELVISETAVKQHLFRLYGKFGIHGEAEPRLRLANEAIRLSAVTLADLRNAAPRTGPRGREVR